MNEEKKPEVLQVKRSNVHITSNGSPQVFLAVESIAWKTGAVQISGIGKTRVEALSNIDASFSNLKNMLSEAQI